MSRQSVLFTVPIRTQGTQNKRDHWAARARRVKEERAAVRFRAPNLRRFTAIAPLVITLTRVWAWRTGGQRPLDGHDNLRAALKPMADEVTALLGYDSDESPSLYWRYGQRQGDEPAVEVRIEGPCKVVETVVDVGTVPIEDPDAHAARQLRENRGVPGSVDDEIAAAMVDEARARRSRKEGRDG